jgi:hypothetical protein
MPGWLEVLMGGRWRFLEKRVNFERKMDQQEEAEGAEEERLARIGGFTCEG